MQRICLQGGKLLADESDSHIDKVLELNCTSFRCVVTYDVVISSPCGSFLQCSGTDNRVYIFDPRKLTVPMAVLCHGSTLFTVILCHYSSTSQREISWSTNE